MNFALEIRTRMQSVYVEEMMRIGLDGMYRVDNFGNESGIQSEKCLVRETSEIPLGRLASGGGFEMEIVLCV